MGCKDFNDQCAKVFPRVGLEPTSLLLASIAQTDWSIEVLSRDRVIALIGQYEWSLCTFYPLVSVVPDTCPSILSVLFDGLYQFAATISPEAENLH